MRAAIVAGLLSALVAQDRSTADLAVGHAFRRLRAEAPHSRVWRRQPIDGGLDVVLAEGHPQ